MTPLLILDVHYLCHRAFHTAKDLSWKSKPTGVIYGFLRGIASLKDEFMTDRIAFCFEHPHLYRKDFFPDYKKRRTPLPTNEQERKARFDLAIQIEELKKVYLPQIGFRNIFSFDSCESDDIMAIIARDCPEDEEVIMVTADADMFQCLRPNVSMFSPQARKILTYKWFWKEYGIHPRKWAMVKAIAGCATDNVPGIPGIGPITALKYIKGDLDPSSKAYLTIRSRESRRIVRRNRVLVQLPLKFCPVPLIQEDRVSVKGWRDVCAKLGMRSIAAKPPVNSRRAI